jgi:hypothetical protein
MTLKEKIIDALYEAKISHEADQFEEDEEIMEFGLAGDDRVIEVKIVERN